MWHEARKQERKIRGMLVDYRKRAERRRDFYEKIKADPTQFLQIHGRQCKIHLDPTIAAAADSSAAMMPWQGQMDNLIDRFDVRAHLDFIPPIKKQDDEEMGYEERQLNYERYRIIAQNSFLAISEEKFLKQLHLEEQFGYTEEPKKKKATGAAIGFNYEDGTGTSQAPAQESSDENSDSDLDVDLSINVSKIDSVQAHEMNRHGRNFGMSSNDFYSFLTNDLEEAESYRMAKEEEHEKALFSGRKSRRERRAHREKRLANRVISPPSYAARTSPTYPTFRDSNSASRSPSPENTGKITYITSFGDDEETTAPKATYADKLKYGSKIKKLRASAIETRTVYLERQKSPSQDRRYRKRHRSRSIEHRNRRSRSRRSRSRSYSRIRRSRSKSRERKKCRRKSMSSRSSSSSISISRSRSRNKSKTRSRSSSSTSRSRSSYSSKSSASSTSKKIKKSRSRSKTPKKEASPKQPLPRYYGRKRSDQSSSGLSDTDDDGNDSKPTTTPISNEKAGSGNSGTSTKKNAGLSLQERLKRKRQALLNKQFKADKIAEQLKSEREKQEQQTREDELREMAMKFRRKQRERRHAYESNSSSSSDHDSNKQQRSPITSSENWRSRSNSPRNNREYRFRDKRRYRKSRDKSRDRSRDRDRDRDRDWWSSDRRRNDDRDRSYRRRDEYRKDREEYRDDVKERERDRDKNSRSLVDY